MKTKLLLTVIFSIGIIGITNAQYAQNDRVRQGVRSGEITRYEASRLRQDEMRLHRDVRRAEADHRLTRREKRELRREQKRHNREIYRMKHNHQVRHF